MRHRHGLRAALIGMLASALLVASGGSASAACTGLTAGTETCSGTFTNLDYTATGDLVLLLQNVQVTTDGITIDGRPGGYDISVIMDPGFAAQSIFSGSDAGIYAPTDTGGDVYISTIPGGTVEGTFGILAYSDGGGDVEINTGDAVTGTDAASAAIFASTDSGIVTIYADGALNATGASSAGITANVSSGTISIDTTANGMVTSTGNGIEVSRSAAGGPISIETYGDIDSGASGISVSSAAGSGSIDILSHGTIFVVTAGDGIFAQNAGGTINIEAYNWIDTINGDGIKAVQSGAGSIFITGDANADIVGFATNGIYALHSGASGDINIDTAGDVGSAGNPVSGMGMVAQITNSANAGGISIISAGDVHADGRGIYGYMAGLGAINIETNNVTSYGAGIFGEYGVVAYADNVSNAGLISITTNGATSSDLTAVYAYTNGLGGITIETNGTVTSTSADGIFAQLDNPLNFAAIGITANDDVSGNDYGIRALTSGAGDITIETFGTVTASDFDGIRADNTGDAGGLITVTANDAITALNGIGVWASTNGTGDVTVTAESTIDANAGVLATGDGGDIGVYTNGAVTAATYGIKGSTTGSGNVIVVSSDTVTASAGHGIEADVVDGVIVVTATGLVDATGGNGIDAHVAGTTGTGAISILAQGGVLSTGDAIHAVNDNADGGVGVIVTAGDLGTSGTPLGGDGVEALITNGLNAGLVNVYADSAIYATGNGIYAETAGTGGVSVTADVIEFGGAYGIYAVVLGASATGGVSVTANDTIAGGGQGIYAANYGSDGQVDVQATSDLGTSGTPLTTGGIVAAIYGLDSPNTDGIIVGSDGHIWTGGIGIAAVTDGLGGIVIDTAAIDSTGDGINAQITDADSAAGIHITANGAIASTAGDGIEAVNAGTGLITIETFAAVSGDPGIVATGGGGPILINTMGTVTGVFDAIHATNIGAGTITINAYDMLTASSGDGIDAAAVDGLIDIYADAAVNATGGDGIAAYTSGLGGIAIETTSNGAIAGTANYGIYAVADGATTGIAIDAGAAIGSSLDRVGDAGIYAVINDPSSAGNLSVTADDEIYSSLGGIYTVNQGSGDLTIVANGVVDTTSTAAISAVNYLSGAVSIETNDAITGDDGIYAISYGGHIGIDADGAINPDGGNGIYVNQYGDTGVDILTSAASAIAGTANNGIFVYNGGAAGETNIAVNADIGSSGDHLAGFGIYSQMSSPNADAMGITVNASIYADNQAIYAYHGGTGGATIDVTGTLTGSSGIDATVSGGTLDIDADGAIFAGSGVGIAGYQYGSGDLLIDTTAATDIAGTANYGILAYHTGPSGNVHVASGGDIGSSVDSVALSGIYAEMALSTGTGDMDITSDGAIYSAGTGIEAYQFGTGALSIVANALVQSSAGDGIYAFSGNAAGGPVSVATNAAVSGSSGILAYSSNDLLDIDVNGSVTSAGNYGVQGTSYGTGDITIDTTANGFISGDAGIGINAQNLGTAGGQHIETNADIGDSGNGVTTYGIYGYIDDSANPDTMEIIANGSIWSDSVAILAQNNGTGSTIVETHGSLNAATGSALSVSGNGLIDLDVDGPVNVAGADAITVTGGGAAVIDLTTTANGDIAGTASDGISVTQNGSGNVTLNIAGGIGSSGDRVDDDGIDARVNVPSGDLDITTTGAIYAEANGILALMMGTATGAITVEAGFIEANLGDGVHAEISNLASAAGITVNVNGAVSSIAGDGVEALNMGSGGVYVTTFAAVSGDPGIVAQGNGGPVVVTTNGTVTALQDGIVANTNGSGTVTVTVNDAISAAAGDGIDSDAVDGLTNIDTYADINATGGNGIFASSTGTGALDITTHSGTIAGSADNGIFAEASGTGGITVLANGAVGTSGDAVQLNGIVGSITNAASTADISLSANAAIFAGAAGAGYAGIIGVTDGTGAVTVLTGGGGDIAGSATYGIYTKINGAGSTGDTTIHANGDIGTSGDAVGAYGIYAENFAAGASGEVEIEVSGDIYSENGGVFSFVRTSGDTLVLTSASSDISSGGIGIRATNLLSGSAAETHIIAHGNVDAGSHGIFANLDTSGDIIVEQDGTILALGSGIVAQHAGTGNVLVISGGSVTGATAINASTVSGGIDVQVGGSLIGAAGNGVNASSSAGGNISVAMAAGSTIDSSAAGIFGDTTGYIDLDTDGAHVIAGTRAVWISNSDTTSLTNSGLLAGDGVSFAVIEVQSSNGTTIGNSGIIQSLTADPAELAIQIGGGAATIQNDGTVIGRIELTGNDDTFVNTSLLSWHTSGTSDFGGGNDSLLNTGGIYATGSTTLAFGAGTDEFDNQETLGVDGALSMTGLESMLNSGTITMLDGAILDTVTTDGTYDGSGAATLAVDVFVGTLAGLQGDYITIAGTVSGTTSVLINDVNPGDGGYNPGILIVDASGGDDGHWAIDPASDGYDPSTGRIDKGLFEYSLLFDPGTSDTLLVGTPDTGAMVLPSFVLAAQEIWYATSPWLSRNADLRHYLMEDGESVTPGVWMKGVGNWTSHESTQTLNTGGPTITFDTSYSQDIVGAVAGIDVGGENKHEAFMIGLMAGYVVSNVDFEAVPTSGEYQGVMLGAYATYLTKEGFFLDGQFKANLMDLDMAIPTLGFVQSDINVENYGVTFDTGFRMGGGLFVEPLATLMYVDTQIDDLTIAGSTIDFNEGSSFRGSLGLRMGGKTNAVRSQFIEMSLTTRVWEEFSNDNGVTITTGPSSLLIEEEKLGTFGEVGGSLNVIDLASGWSGFLNGGVRFNDAYTSSSVTGGVRFQW